MSGYPNQPPPHSMSYPQYGIPPAGQPGFPVGQPGYAGQQPYGQPGYQGQPTVQPGYPGQPAGQPGYAGQPAGQPGYAGQPAGQPGYPGQLAGQPGYPGQAPQPGFSYQNVYPNINPTPTAPEFGYAGYPNVSPQPSYGAVQWVQTTPTQAIGLSDRAVVAGYEGYDGSPLWVIRARFEGDLIPGKLAVKHHAAYVPWGGKENPVKNIEVCCAPAERIKWVDSRDGVIPPNAIVAGTTSDGEPLYVGRAKEQGALTPGKVHPSHKALYVSFAGNEIPHKIYQIMCNA